MHALGQISATSAAHSLAWLLQARELIRQEEALPEPEGEIEFIEVPDMRERWDCESVLSVSSNLYNHPGRIAEPRQRIAEGIRLSRKTGGPVGHFWATAVRCGLSHLPRACRPGTACSCLPMLCRVVELQLSLLLISPNVLAAGLPVAVPATPVQDSEASTVTGLSTQPAAAAASQPRQRGATAEQRRERKQGIKMAQVSCQDTCIQQTSL